ncbi:hypothetical protein GCK32_006307 [Trichostrongylus colubriformis]|uniref:Uncharacterized protein n=1 Tax=Trichostrongylus colubriformis TaxID=6319 RepID=A0AAN8FBC9_TRICO
MFMLHMCAADVLFALITMVPTMAITATVPVFYGPAMLGKFVEFLQSEASKHGMSWQQEGIEGIPTEGSSGQNSNFDQLQPVIADVLAPAPLGEERYLNVVLSVPDDVVDEFYFGDRLPKEIRQLFPELLNARVCIVEPFAGQKRFMSLHIPLIRPVKKKKKTSEMIPMIRPVKKKKKKTSES